MGTRWGGVLTHSELDPLDAPAPRIHRLGANQSLVDPAFDLDSEASELTEMF